MIYRLKYPPKKRHLYLIYVWFCLLLCCTHHIKNNLLFNFGFLQSKLLRPGFDGLCSFQAEDEASAALHSRICLLIPTVSFPINPQKGLSSTSSVPLSVHHCTLRYTHLHLSYLWNGQMLLSLICMTESQTTSFCLFIYFFFRSSNNCSCMAEAERPSFLSCSAFPVTFTPAQAKRPCSCRRWCRLCKKNPLSVTCWTFLIVRLMILFGLKPQPWKPNFFLHLNFNLLGFCFYFLLLILPSESLCSKVFSLSFILALKLKWTNLCVSNRHYVDRIWKTTHHLTNRNRSESDRLCMFG